MMGRSKTTNNQLNANVGLWKGLNEKKIYKNERFKGQRLKCKVLKRWQNKEHESFPSTQEFSFHIHCFNVLQSTSNELNLSKQGFINQWKVTCIDLMHGKWQNYFYTFNAKWNLTKITWTWCLTTKKQSQCLIKGNKT